MKDPVTRRPVMTMKEETELYTEYIGRKFDGVLKHSLDPKRTLQKYREACLALGNDSAQVWGLIPHLETLQQEAKAAEITAIDNMFVEIWEHLFTSPDMKASDLWKKLQRDPGVMVNKFYKSDGSTDLETDLTKHLRGIVYPLLAGLTCFQVYAGGKDMPGEPPKGKGILSKVTAFLGKRGLKTSAMQHFAAMCNSVSINFPSYVAVPALHLLTCENFKTWGGDVKTSMCNRIGGSQDIKDGFSRLKERGDFDYAELCKIKAEDWSDASNSFLQTASSKRAVGERVITPDSQKVSPSVLDTNKKTKPLQPVLPGQNPKNNANADSNNLSEDVHMSPSDAFGESTGRDEEEAMDEFAMKKILGRDTPTNVRCRRRCQEMALAATHLPTIDALWKQKAEEEEARLIKEAKKALKDSGKDKPKKKGKEVKVKIPKIHKPVACILFSSSIRSAECLTLLHQTGTPNNYVAPPSKFKKSFATLKSLGKELEAMFTTTLKKDEEKMAELTRAADVYMKIVQEVETVAKAIFLHYVPNLDKKTEQLENFLKVSKKTRDVNEYYSENIKNPLQARFSGLVPEWFAIHQKKKEERVAELEARVANATSSKASRAAAAADLLG